MREFTQESRSSIKDLGEDQKSRVKELADTLTKRIDVALGIYEPAKLLILGENGINLEGQIIPARIERSTKDDKHTINIFYVFILKNIGGKFADEILFKIYTADPITIVQTSPKPQKPLDEKEYDYEFYIPHLQNKLPSGAYFRITHRLGIPEVIPPGTYPIALKVYYGINQQEQLHFKIKIEE